MKKKQKQLGQYIFTNHDFEGSTDEFLKKTAPLIGYLVHSFNALDAALNSTVCMLINDRADKKGAIIIHKMSFLAKVDLFYKLVKSMKFVVEKDLPSFPCFIENLKKCAIYRNAVIHAEWNSMKEDGYTYVKMSFEKNGLQQQYWQFTPESLIKINNFIDQVGVEFDTFDNELQELL
ncbi:MAG: hypothetical protein LBG15_15490 [Dysgonamonadaceae bacterium]|jgi:hypothetical protein|nr:hypothetical protein [Dysgonamonadaceae bacterium]